eukprot:11689585-Prorocentrum_lima.AAC.1
MDSQAKVEPEHRMIALQAQEQLQLDRLKESEMAIQFELTSELNDLNRCSTLSRRKAWTMELSHNI